MPAAISFLTSTHINFATHPTWCVLKIKDRNEKGRFKKKVVSKQKFPKMKKYENKWTFKKEMSETDTCLYMLIIIAWIMKLWLPGIHIHYQLGS